ncbi:hypothetical protein [Agarivorans gilvus]|uniref:Galactose-1-phosphate uridylyltransferase n=1 Tax=Agarivorans gilvus TaxID=680279 RepID=A0ABQ1I4A1_9ALTE|nr:hypothetical protein [Agarivorans gilvus]GGB13742.1 galactose-1-phosphate uridylyltransferase [Agarivorans gilvus]
MTQQLALSAAKALAISEHLDQLQFRDLLRNISEDPQLKQFAPDGVCHIDPRNGNLIIYNSARAKRIHTTAKPTQTSQDDYCPICDGKSADILDIAEHSEGFTFINKNLYPIFHPIEQIPKENADYFLHQDPFHTGRASYGFHLLQWTSSLHHRDWHNMPFEDALISFQRLAQLEKDLLHQPSDFMASSETHLKQQDVVSGYVSIIKNYGASAGASLVHGHQQIAYSNILPQHFFNNLRFRQRHNKAFSQYMIEENPKQLLIKDYGEMQLMVPYFMKRPLDMLLIVKNSEHRYLHQLTAQEQQQMVKAIQQTIAAILALMEQMGLPPAYNMIVNNGPGCGLYLEFLPKTQMMGGYEQIGLFVCQANASDSAQLLRQEILTSEHTPADASANGQTE